MRDNAFNNLLEQQRAIQVLIKGVDPGRLPPDEKMSFIMETGFAMVHEIVEATSETGWKPWATSNHLNSDAYRGELADVFIFLMNAMLIDGMTMKQMYDLVAAKQLVNIKRQQQGYDGVSTKCPSCKKAYDDPATECYPEKLDTNPAFNRMSWCATKKTHPEIIAVTHPDPDKSCLGCGRDYGRPDVHCAPKDSLAPDVMAWCAFNQCHYKDNGYPA